MSFARNLYQLQYLELEIESLESRIAALAARMNDRRSLDEASASLEASKTCIEDLKKSQHSLDWEIEDIAGRLAKESEALYSGRIKNPRELSGLKHEADTLKAKKDSLEDGALGLMEQLERVETEAVSQKKKLRKLEGEWRVQRQELSAELGSLNDSLQELNEKRAQAMAGVGQEMAAVYSELKKQKGRAVAIVEQGVCRGCGLSLSSAWLQRARGELVRCSSCGRILFLE